MHACSAVARNKEKYQAFRNEFYQTIDKNVFLTAMKNARNEYLDTRFCQERTASLVIKTLEVVGIMTAMIDPAIEFVRFLHKHFKRSSNEIAKRKGEFPEAIFFGRWAKSVHEVMEQVSVYALLYMEYHNTDDINSVKAADGKVNLFLDTIPFMLEDSARNQKYSGRISNEERRLRNALHQDGGPVLTYFNDNDRNMLGVVSSHFCFSDVLSYDFTEKDANALARCIVRDYFEQQEDFIDGSNEDEFKDIMDPDTFNDIKRRMRSARSQSDSIDLNYARLVYAFGKVSENDRAELIDIYISNIPKDDKAKDPDETLRRAINEKNFIIRKKQAQLNHLQLELDKTKSNLAEAKEKYINAKHVVENMLKLLKEIQSGTSQVTDIEKDNKEIFPENTILFGGHPNWIRKFRLKYPGVKVYDADNMSFTAEAIRNADLVLLNVSHMSHKQYGPVIRVVRKYHKNVRYVR